MIAFPAGVRVWIAGGVTDMRRGMPVSRLPELLPWNWRQGSARRRAA